jgi:DNA helicase-2/ATP-dependent DNA helicase PcrA
MTEKLVVPNCPKCSLKMVMRTGRYGRFWGCAGYPKCKGTADVRTEVPDDDDNYEPSEYQQAIFEWLQNREPGTHLIVNALAGSGKTSTGLRMLQYTEGLDVLFVAFNKSIQKELARRAPHHVTVKTYHSLGFGACKDAYGVGMKDIDKRKVYRLLPDILDKNRYKALFPAINNIVSLVKANLEEPSDEVLWQIVDRYGVEVNGDAEVIFEAVRAAIKHCAKTTNKVDFDDMCWLPIVHNLPMHQYDIVIVDEAQDTNKNQIALALKSVKDEGSIIAVGDDFQAIYGFRGADTDAIPNLRKELDADTLPLSITYRCPRKIVEFINAGFPHIPLEYWEGNKYDGRIFYWSNSQAMSAWKDGDMVLCRTNAPLVSPCFSLIRRGVKATIRGRDIGKNLIALVDRMTPQTIVELITNLTTYKDLEIPKLIAANKNSAASALEDKVDTVIALTDGINTLDGLRDKIESVFTDDSEGVVFSSIHRAKGLQAERVSILRPDLFPHPYAKQGWEMEQEANIEYVAYTRTQRDLVFVS